MPIKDRLDCFGDICPVPILKLEKALKSLAPGESVTAVTDHSCVQESVIETFSKRNVFIDSCEVMNGVWEITVTKR